MRSDISDIFFDRRDYDLLGIVNDVLNRDQSFRFLKNLLHPYLHPHGIKEMSASRGLRIAYAVVRLLESLVADKADDRLSALRSLQVEVLYGTDGHLQRNTARVLLQIMKELVRSRYDYLRQLELAHDFRIATSGKPRVIRALLHRYHLLEMPEEWNQQAFDDHVHDSSTKGRKSPSHLIMDAWIKGIRKLTVIYYNYARPEAIAELMEAAQIMGITVRAAIEFSVKFRDRYAQLIWVPRGFSEAKDFLQFLAKPEVTAFMEEGRKVSEYQQRYVLRVLQEFNARHSRTIKETYGIDLAPLDESEFISFVGVGQASLLHLSIFIHARMLFVMEAHVAELRQQYAGASPEERLRIAGLVEEMNRLDSEAVLNGFLRPSNNPSIPDPHAPRDGPDVPRLLTLSPYGLIEELTHLHSSNRIILNLSNLKEEDFLELLYDCKGAISHLEIFNLKDYTDGKTSHILKINELQLAFNKGSVIQLKRLIRKTIRRLETAPQEIKPERVEKLREILRNIGELQSYYQAVPLIAYVGSDSTGHSRRLHGMGLAIKETLPRRAQREVARSHGNARPIIPIRTAAYLRATYIPHQSSSHWVNEICQLIRRLPGLRTFGQRRRDDWVLEDTSTRIENDGNVVTLGGVHEERGNGLYLEPPQSGAHRTAISWKYLNTSLKNGLKVLIGFIPAFLTFALTKDWWLLAYFGAFIWFAITGLRIILQSVLGGGGIRRSPLLRMDDYVSWERLADSLLYTGFSVPLLDYVVKTLILDRSFGITTATSPIALYSAMALANGLYVSSHNAFRGLPKGAVVGNFFRSIFSIPLAIGLNAAVGGILMEFDVSGIPDILQKWAAIISKAASDCVAGFIEGLADRYENIRLRLRDYTGKLRQLFDTYAQLELLFPEADVLKMLESPKEFMRVLSAAAGDLEKIMIINALDLLYFWMYQPRARNVLCGLLRNMSYEERQILVRSQFVLQRNREISLLFLDGIVGKKFSRALSFYLARSSEYLEALEKAVHHSPCVKGFRPEPSGNSVND